MPLDRHIDHLKRHNRAQTESGMHESVMVDPWRIHFDTVQKIRLSKYQRLSGQASHMRFNP